MDGRDLCGGAGRYFGAYGEHSLVLLSARAWETLLGGVLGVGAAMLLFLSRGMSRGEGELERLSAGF